MIDQTLITTVVSGDYLYCRETGTTTTSVLLLFNRHFPGEPGSSGSPSSPTPPLVPEDFWNKWRSRTEENLWGLVGTRFFT